MIFVLILCVRKRKVRIEEQICDSIKYSSNVSHNSCYKDTEEEAIDAKKDNNLSSNEANNESTKSSSLSLNSRLRINDSNQMTDLRLKINDSMIRSPNLIDYRQEDTDIYDVPPKRMSPNIVATQELVNQPDQKTPLTIHHKDDFNHIYDSPR